jgi:F0F1-type ATP synthase alpha subunit
MLTPSEFMQSLPEEQVSYLIEVMFALSKSENAHMLETILEEMDLSDEAIGSLLSIINQYSGNIR